MRTIKNSMDPKYSHKISANFIDQVNDCAIFAMDPKGIITTWNVGAERIKGYKEEEIIGQYYGVLFTEEDQKKGEPEREIELTKKHGKNEAEWWRRRKDGTLFWASIVLTAVYDNEDELIGFTKVTKDLTYRKAHEDVLQKKSDDLAKVNKDLDHFIYIASHDLKAPILNLEALTQLLMNEVDKIGSFNTKVIELHKHIKDSITRFKKTVDELSDLNRLQRSKDKEGYEETVDMQQVFEDVMADMAFLFDKFQFPCEVSTDFQVRVISLSPKNFRSILYNLLSNSIKYRSNKRNCQVQVQTIQVEKGVVLTVKDNGLGMNEQNLEQLYIMFRRFHSHVEGSGIGLHLVKRIVDSAGGSIEVTSAEDEGTEFKILFKSEAIT